MSGEIQLKGGNNDADILINTMSMIGDAVEGTYDAVTKDWKYASTAGDMKYDANERCFSLTISTVEGKYAKSHFRFVANHDAKQNWGETDGNISSKKDLQELLMMPLMMTITLVWLAIPTTCSSVKRRERMRRTS